MQNIIRGTNCSILSRNYRYVYYHIVYTRASISGIYCSNLSVFFSKLPDILFSFFFFGCDSPLRFYFLLGFDVLGLILMMNYRRIRANDSLVKLYYRDVCF